LWEDETVDFERAHQQFIQYHMGRRTGERKGRLNRGNRYGETLFLKNVWWPMFGNFEHLHPEYEVYDWKRKSQFIDYAYFPRFGNIGIECDGFQTHVKDMDRDKFSYALNRDTFLTGMGWRMVHFSVDDIRDHPEMCRSLLQLVISRHTLNESSIQPLKLIEREILILAIHLARYIQPKDVIEHFEVDFRTARKWLRSLVEKEWLEPIEIGGVIRCYELKENLLEFLI
jgi:hypothetical protein